MKILSILAFAAILVASCSENSGGMSAGYPARDYDPTLTEFALTLVPLITAIGEKKKEEGDIPQTIDSFSDLIEDPLKIYYNPEKEYYRIGIKLGWDPVLWFDSRNQTWTFDPGDGSPSQEIKLRVDPDAGLNSESLRASP